MCEGERSGLLMDEVAWLGLGGAVCVWWWWWIWGQLALGEGVYMPIGKAGGEGWACLSRWGWGWGWACLS